MKNESLRNWLIGILTVVVIILTAGGAFTLRSFVDEAVDETLDDAVKTAVAGAVDSAVEEAVDAIRFDTAVADLNFRGNYSGKLSTARPARAIWMATRGLYPWFAMDWR